MEFSELYKKAVDTLNPRQLSRSSYAGTVAAAILGGNGKVYTGVCIDTPASMGFCAEHSAIATMISDGESRILKVVSVYKDKKIIPPCGRCREFISQIHDDNIQCEVMLGENHIVTIHDMLPYHTQYK